MDHCEELILKQPLQFFPGKSEYTEETIVDPNNGVFIVIPALHDSTWNEVQDSLTLLTEPFQQSIHIYSPSQSWHPNRECQ